jgi:hypothetical protein
MCGAFINGFKIILLLNNGRKVEVSKYSSETAETNIPSQTESHGTVSLFLQTCHNLTNLIFTNLHIPHMLVLCYYRCSCAMLRTGRGPSQISLQHLPWLICISWNVLMPNKTKSVLILPILAYHDRHPNATSAPPPPAGALPSRAEASILVVITWLPDFTPRRACLCFSAIDPGRNKGVPSGPISIITFHRWELSHIMSALYGATFDQCRF